jgi:DNA repair protein RadC
MSNHIEQTLVEHLLVQLNIPDASSVARTLIYEYGSLLNLLTNINTYCMPDVVQPVVPVLKTIHAMFIQIHANKLQRGCVMSNIEEIVRMFRLLIACKTREELYIVMFDKHACIIKYELISIGTFDCLPASPREILRCCLNCAASSVILVHNHPSGSSIPSAADIQYTHTLRNLLTSVDITLVDHLIITSAEHTSFSSNGLM